jgi:thymidine kinase
MTEKKRGQLELVLGPMFAGKSTELQRRARRLRAARRAVLVVTHADDARHEDGAEKNTGRVVTHDRVAVDALPVARLEDALDEALRHDAVAVDEGHLFADLAAFCERCAAAGVDVVVAACDRDTARRPFRAEDGFSDPLALPADRYTQLVAVCACGADAPFTRRKDGGDSKREIGAADAYEAVCGQCYCDH